MNNGITDKRRQSAVIAHAYIEKKITWQQFMDETANFRDDELIDELVDLIEHEPKRGGFMGVNEKEWYEYRQSIRDAIAVLEK